jgi:hypothetical protein
MGGLKVYKLEGGTTEIQSAYSSKRGLKEAEVCKPLPKVSVTNNLSQKYV